MTAARLLEHFDRVSEAPGAVPRLRRFILDLAVRGKLVARDPSDEPASELLKIVEAKRVQLDERNARRKGRHLPQVQPSEIPFAIPRGWAVARMGDLVTKLGAGSTPLGGKSVYQADGILFLRSQNVHDAGLRLDDVARISAAIHARMSGTHVEPRDILLNITGASIGRSSLVPDVFPDANVSQHVAIVRLRVPELRQFIHLSLISPVFQQRIADVQVGVSREGLSMQRLRRFPMLIPPLAEQNRIVTRVNELMALCDRLEAAQAERETRRDRVVAASLQRLNEPAEEPQFREDVQFHLDHLRTLTARIEQVRDLRQSVLNLAVRDRLVAPLSALDRESSVPHQRDPFATGGGQVKEDLDAASQLPEAWTRVELGALLLGDSQNGYSKKPDDDPNGIPILRISAGTVRQDGIVAEEEYKLIGGVTAAQRAQFALKSGDLLACRFNGNRRFVGRLSEYRGYLGLDPIYPDKLIRLRLSPKLALPALVRRFAESDLVRFEIEQHCATTVGNWGISATNLKRVLIPLPPLAEQHRIVAKVDELMAVCDRLEAQISTGEATSSRLLDALLHEAVADPQATPLMEAR